VRNSLVLAAALGTAALAAPLAAQWRTVVPGGDTICSDGSPYRFFVHPGDPGKLLVEFEGGGGCWDAQTCALDIYNRRVLADPADVGRQGLLQGIYDRTRTDNPLRDFTHVYIPYCTGDLHWGNTTQTYAGSSGPYTIHHRGGTNAASALAWTYDNVLAPSQVVVAGCSAGGYGATAWSANVMARYPGASAAHLSDSAAGIIPEGFFQKVLRNWGVAASPAWPNFIPAVTLERLDTPTASLPDLYDGVAGYFPLSAFSQFNTALDTTQIFFYVMTNPPVLDDWPVRMPASVARIRGANPNFFSYTAPGSQHCVINRPEFYTTTVGGVRFSDWVSQLVATRRPGSVPAP
jgi:hypothetical protein